MPITHYTKLGHTHCRIPDNGPVWLESGELCEWIAARYKVPARALAAALSLIKDGLIEAVASGYAVRIRGLMQMQIREVKSFTRHTKHYGVVTTKPSTTVHIRKSPTLKGRVKAVAEALAAQASDDAIMTLVNPVRARHRRQDPTQFPETETAAVGGLQGFAAKSKKKHTLR